MCVGAEVAAGKFAERAQCKAKVKSKATLPTRQQLLDELFFFLCRRFREGALVRLSRSLVAPINYRPKNTGNFQSMSRGAHSTLVRCPSTVRPVFPMLAFRTVLEQRDFPWNSFEALAFSIGFPSESPQAIDTFTAWSRTRDRAQTLP